MRRLQGPSHNLLACGLQRSNHFALVPHQASHAACARHRPRGLANCMSDSLLQSRVKRRPEIVLVSKRQGSKDLLKRLCVTNEKLFASGKLSSPIGSSTSTPTTVADTAKAQHTISSMSTFNCRRSFLACILCPHSQCKSRDCCGGEEIISARSHPMLASIADSGTCTAV